jgi:hypothetical protein
VAIPKVSRVSGKRSSLYQPEKPVRSLRQPQPAQDGKPLFETPVEDNVKPLEAA